MAGEAMDVELVLDSMREWFSRVSYASLHLPNGWFGRPMDNMHQLTWTQIRNETMLAELDDQLLLVCTGPTNAEASEFEFRLSGFDQLVFIWQQYGSREPHAETFQGGVVRFAAFGARSS